MGGVGWLLLSLLLVACSDDKSTASSRSSATANLGASASPPATLLPMPLDTPTPLPLPTATPLANGPHVPNPAFLRWAYYIPDDPASQASLKANLGELDIVSPAYFIISADGEVRGSDHAADTALIQSRGVKLVPMLQNNPLWDKLHDFISDPAWVNKTINKLEELVNRYHYDGFQIDLEAVNRDDQDNLTGFMSRLYERLHSKGKLVTMAVGSKLSAIGNKFGGAYDYYALGNYVDYVTIMTYDYSYAGGDPGPIAPLQWVKAVAEYAASQFGPRKVLLGVPFYGYEWNTSQHKYVNGRSYTGVQNLVTKYNGQLKFDEIYQSPYATFVQDGDTHQIWFEDERSLTAKFDLVGQLGLGGFAAWRLGQEGSGGWSAIGAATPPTSRQNQKIAVPAGGQYLAASGHILSPLFKNFWYQHDGLKLLGLPLTDEMPEKQVDGSVLRVQYFQNGRLEAHPQVVLGAVGREVTANLSDNYFFTSPPANSSNLPNCGDKAAASVTQCYFPQTGQSLANGFKTFWEGNGGLPMFGLPLSREFVEQNPFDGQTYTVQYFERARLQYDPVSHKITPGAVGAQLLWQRGWMR